MVRHAKLNIVKNKVAHTAMYAFVPMKVFAMESISCKNKQHNFNTNTTQVVKYATSQLQAKKN